jgi:hypothetical protein
MHKDIQAHFEALVGAVQGTAIPAERKGVVTRCVQRVSSLYTKLHETNESRYSDELTALVQGVLRELEVCPEAQKLDAPFRAKLRFLHEELGVPTLALKSAPPHKSTKRIRTKKEPSGPGSKG